MSENFSKDMDTNSALDSYYESKDLADTNIRELDSFIEWSKNNESFIEWSENNELLKEEFKNLSNEDKSKLIESLKNLPNEDKWKEKLLNLLNNNDVLSNRSFEDVISSKSYWEQTVLIWDISIDVNYVDMDMSEYKSKWKDYASEKYPNQVIMFSNNIMWKTQVSFLNTVNYWWSVNIFSDRNWTFNEDSVNHLKSKINQIKID